MDDDSHSPVRRKLTEEQLARRAEEHTARTAPIDSYHPDRHPSFSKSFRDEVEPDVMRWVLQVKGLGCFVIRSNRTTKTITCSNVTKEDVGPCPDL